MDTLVPTAGPITDVAPLAAAAAELPSDVGDSSAARVGLLMAALARRIGPSRRDVWFRNSARIRLEDGRVDVQVPNSFIARLLSEEYGEPLGAAAVETLGASASVRFVVAPEAFAEAGVASAHAGTSESIPGPVISGPARSGSASRAPASREWLPHELPGGRRFRLDEFVVGPSNRMAHATAVQVVERPGACFNPLFIHGACGLGKTHLLLGVAAAFEAKRTGLQVAYLSGEEFTNQYLAAMKAGKLERFRREVRGLDVLILDDVHFLSGKDKTQEEFLNTFKALEANGRQVVLASDRSPQELAEFRTHLVSRFVAGMVVAVHPPDRATRRAIVAAKAERAGHRLGADVLDHLADHVRGNAGPANVRDLEGGVNRLLAGSVINQGRVDLALARDLIPPTDAASSPPRSAGRPVPPLVARLEAAVAEAFAVAVVDLAGNKRSNGLNLARTALMYLLRTQTNWTFQQIADHLGRKNHSTVVVACRKMQEHIDSGDRLAMPGYAPENLPTAGQVIARLAEAAKRPGGC